MRLLINVAALLVALTFLPASAGYAQDSEVSLGTTLPMMDRSMPAATGAERRLTDLRGERGIVLVFWSNDCPWVDRYEERLLQAAAQFSGEGFGFVLINSNDPVAFPDESLAGIRDRAARSGYDIPYVRDEGAELARALGASRTPHVFVFDASNALIYSGTIDDSPGDPGNVASRYLHGALAAVVAGGAVPTARTTAFGCRIRYGQ